MKFKRQSIKVASPGPTLSVQAYCHGVLAIHRAVVKTGPTMDEWGPTTHKKFKVSHIPSGFAISPELTSLDKAKSFLGHALVVADDISAYAVQEKLTGSVDSDLRIRIMDYLNTWEGFKK